MSATLRPRSTAASADEQAEALSCPVRDPMWFLSRQWQTGSYTADDGGDPVRVALATSTAPVTATSTGDVLTQPGIEAEPAASATVMDTAARVTMAAELFRIMRDQPMSAGRVTAVRTALAAALPLRPVTAASAAAPHAGRLPDAAALITLLAGALDPDGTGEPFPAIPGVDLTADHQVEPALRTWYAWTLRQAATLGSTGDSRPPSWDGVRLAYAAPAQARLKPGGLDLHLDAYDGTGLDWYAFDRGVLAPATIPASSPATVRPSPVTFAGMPEPRFWAFERGDVNLDLISGADPAHTLLATFAHAYSNDWFLVPLDVAPGATMIDLLQVTDSFGSATTAAPAAALDAPACSWRMWEITPDSVTASDAALGVRVFLPPGPPPLEGPVLEDLLIARDELANLGWIIELATRDEDGGAVDRNRRWLRLRPATDPGYNPATARDATSYRLGTSLPDYWYPLLAQAGPGQPSGLALATLPPGAADVPDDGVAGLIIPHTAQTLLADEEAAGTGTRVTRVSRLTRVGGTRAGWRARVRRPGTGEASSGLRFDILGGPAVAPNLVSNPDFIRARREQPPVLSGHAVAGLAAAGNWGLWNNPATDTSSRVEPTTRPGGTGWMLRVTTGAGGCGLVQQWASTGNGPAAGQAEAWVYVVRGSVTLGSGNGGSTGGDKVSSSAGQWERLAASSGSGPVNEVIIYAASPGGAEFLIDFVAVRPAT
ncbi:MAG TPA: hypothetical protein VGH88_03690 [Streptosporangiaceae bacterium]